MRLASLLLLLLTPASLRGQDADPGYRLAVVSESGDRVTWLRPGAGTLAVEKIVPIGLMPTDVDGPHHVAMAPDGRSYFVSIAHGQPFGTLWRMEVGTDAVIGRAPLEMFPTTISVTPDGDLAFVANSDFHGIHPRENVVTVVHIPSMTTITNIAACDMPHGVRVNHAGTFAYVTCMHSDELLEIDAGSLQITRRHPARLVPAGEHADHASSPGMDHEGCMPTFVSVSPDDATLYVACNHGNSLQVWDAATFMPVKEVAAGAGAYNVEASPDGRWVIVTNKKAQSVSLFDARRLVEVERIPTTRKIVHGVTYSPDVRYAFITQESIGADSGAVDMLDLTTRKTVATVPIPAQPTGIAVWTGPRP